MKGKSLLDDVSMEELNYMRHEEGLSNVEIAQRLGVHPQTIIRLMGKQPIGNRSASGLASAYKAQRRNAAEEQREMAARPSKDSEQPEEAVLMVENRTVCLVGMAAQYEVDEKNHKVLIKKPGDAFRYLDYESIDSYIEELNTFAKELTAIARKIKTPTAMEVW